MDHIFDDSLFVELTLLIFYISDTLNTKKFTKMKTDIEKNPKPSKLNIDYYLIPTVFLRN